MTAWSAEMFAIEGRYSSRSDLIEEAAALQSACGGPILVLTTSVRYPLPSLSVLIDGDGQELGLDLEKLQRGLAPLRETTDQSTVLFGVASTILAVAVDKMAFETVGIDRPIGGLRVSVAASFNVPGDFRARVRRIAACALGSRLAAVHRESSIDLSFYRQLRMAASNPSALISDDDEALSTLAHSVSIAATDNILNHGREMLGALWLGLYVNDSHGWQLDRWSEHQSESAVRLDSRSIPDWFPALSESVPIPPPPELGGSRFADISFLGALAGARLRRLAGTLGHQFVFLIVPFDAEVAAGSQGLLAVIWPSLELSHINSYTLAASRLITTHIGREWAERQSLGAVASVASQLRELARGVTAAANRAAAAIAVSPHIATREDVRLIHGSVGNVLRDLARMTRAASVTCRLIAGGEGDAFSRGLYRIHCEGSNCASDSPDVIPLEDRRNHVNSWVASTGKSVYISDLSDLGALDPYPELERAGIYRDGVRSELCVPIFAEGRLVGTINLESFNQHAFARFGDVVEECAQVIGLALLQARRIIGVRTMADAGGFLDRSHTLDGHLENLQIAIGKADVPSSADWIAELELVRTSILSAVAPVGQEVAAECRAAEVVRAAFLNVRWASSRADESGPDSWDSPLLDGTLLDGSAASALQFAVEQVLHNLRRHSSRQYELLWSSPLRVAASTYEIGGRQNLCLLLQSVCNRSAIEGLVPQQVFREPIERRGRISFGTYLAGELLRRIGGAAIFRVEQSDLRGLYIASNELSVPVVEREDLGGNVSSSLR